MTPRPTTITTGTEPTAAPPDSADPTASARVVIAHDFAETFGGAERIAAEIAAAFPEAPFWAILGRPEVAARMGVADRFRTLLPGGRLLFSSYRALAPAYPLLTRIRRLPEAEVLVTSSYAFAHALATRNHAPQVCYCYSPLRFAWSMTDEYARSVRGGRAAAALLKLVAAPFRALDRRAARRVHTYVAESHYVADQIRRFYGREPRVIWPPVDCERFRPAPDGGGHEGFFLFCGRLIEPYKQPTLAVRAFAGLPHRLLVAGDGPELGRLRRIATPNVEFLGHLSDAELVPLMQRCAAAVFPSRDDFGLTPVEVMACGRPVIAYAAGGALETVAAGRTGVLFGEQTAEALRRSVAGFDPDSFDPAAIRVHAERWDARRFRASIRDVVAGALA